MMEIVRFLCRLTCDSCIPCLKESWFEFGWAIISELGWTVGMVLGASVGYLLEGSFSMFLWLALVNSFVIWEGYLFGVSLDTLGGMMIGNGAGSLVGLHCHFHLDPHLNLLILELCLIFFNFFLLWSLGFFLEMILDPCLTLLGI